MSQERPFDYAVMMLDEFGNFEVVYYNGSKKSAIDEARERTLVSGRRHIVAQFIDLFVTETHVRGIAS